MYDWVSLAFFVGALVGFFSRTQGTRGFFVEGCRMTFRATGLLQMLPREMDRRRDEAISPAGRYIFGEALTLEITRPIASGGRGRHTAVGFMVAISRQDGCQNKTRRARVDSFCWNGCRLEPTTFWSSNWQILLCLL